MPSSSFYHIIRLYPQIKIHENYTSDLEEPKDFIKRHLIAFYQFIMSVIITATNTEITFSASLSLC